MTKATDTTKATTDAPKATDTTPATNDAPTTTSAYGAFVATLATNGKAPAFVTPRDLAAHFDRDERRVRAWLRSKAGVYATAQRDGAMRHMFATTDPATRAMFDAMSRAFATNGTAARKGATTYTEVDWSTL